MFMKKILAFFLLSVNFIAAQSEQKPGLSAREFENAKSLYVKMMESEDYKKKEQLNNLLMPILKEADGFQDFIKLPTPTEEKVLDWIKSNVAPEKVEKATQLFTEVLKLEAKILLDNNETFKLYQKATRNQQLEILEPLFKKTEEKYKY